MLIRYRNGLLAEAVILSLTGSRLRVAIKGGDDVVEYRLINDTWISEDGEPVTFDFSMTILAAAGIVPPADLTAPSPEPAPVKRSLLDFPCSAGRAN